MDPKQPLWLPKGSVRAILALSFVGATIYGVLSSLHDGDVVSGPLAALLAITSIVVNNYFEKRASAS